jgi:hypothetical protein
MRIVIIMLALIAMLAVPAVASAADYKCKGNSVEKSGSTKYKVRMRGSDIYIEKSGSTKGKAVKRGSKWSVEVSGSTKAQFDDKKIYKSNSSWATISDAQRVFDCKPEWAATLWVLQKIGKL